MSKKQPKAAKHSELDNESYVSSIHDLESETDPHEQIISYKIDLTHSVELSELQTFLEKDPKMVNSSGNPTTNIVDRMKGVCYNIPDQKIPKFFQLLERVRRADIRVMFSERQTDYTGIMLDFDIYQDGEEDQISNELFQTLTQKIMTVIMSVVNFTDKRIETYVCITRRPHIKYEETAECYKDGFHILIPGIQIKKSVKKLVIQKLIEKDIIERVFEDITPTESRAFFAKHKKQRYTKSDFLDQNSSHVPVFFIGSATKIGSVSYRPTHFYKVILKTEDNECIISNADIFIKKSANFNICHEFSLKWEVSNGIIKKNRYDVKDKYANETEISEEKIRREEEQFTKNYGELSTNAAHDAKIGEIKELLDILDSSRSSDYRLWRSVLCALANESISYKDLAEYFSRKSPKFNPVDFETHWNEIVNKRKTSDKSITIASLYHWAKSDNPERYELLRKNTANAILYNMVYEPYKEGILQHADIALILHKLLKHKFIVDKPAGGKKLAWFEFVMEDDAYIPGELYKWRMCNPEPTSLINYISERLPLLFGKVYNGVLKRYSDSASTTIGKWYGTVLKNYKATMRQLQNVPYIANVVRASEAKFHKMGFCETLDKDPLIKGVANGVLKLSVQKGVGPKLIQGFHAYNISKYTKAEYVPFNPYDPVTKLILQTLRNMFPDDEPDTFEFMMCYLASTIDSRAKESIFLMMIGGGSNGKSVLTELHKAAIGEKYSAKMPLSYLTSTYSDAERATPAVMQLADADLAVYSESNKDEKLNEARIKEVTGLETLAGRKLNCDMVNFKPHCHHLVTTNHAFIIQGSDNGIWRRIKYVKLKITFINTNDKVYDANDPYQRIADTNVQDTWASDPVILSRYLSIMVWYHYKLNIKYRGKVAAVDHPHIQFDTAKYRRSQDIVEQFLSQRLCKCADPTEQVNIQDEIRKYINWYTANVGAGNTLSVKSIVSQFQYSRVNQFMKTTARCTVLEGYRFLDNNEKPREGEEYATTQVVDIVPDNNFGIEPENADQMYERTCREYEEIKNLFRQDSGYDIALDAMIDYEACTTLGAAQYTQASNEDSKINENRVVINGNIQPKGVSIKVLEEDNIKSRKDNVLLVDSSTCTELEEFITTTDVMCFEVIE